MSATNFSTSNQSLRQLLANGLNYRVPPFQRDYSWNQDEWDELWQDLQGTLQPDGEPMHYMGYLVLQSRDGREFDLIDGQQRLTTLSLLVLATLRALRDLVEQGIDPTDNTRRAEQLRATYIGSLDPVTLVARSKLKLNRHNDDYYQRYLVPLETLPKRNRRPSEHLLRRGFEWFYDRIRETYRERWTGSELARLVDHAADKLLFTVINVNDELNAFKVFETLNARGVRLSPTDLLKNYLFSVIHRERGDEVELAELEGTWEELLSRLGSESFTGFLRVYWNSRHKFVREAELFKTIRAATPDRQAAFGLLRDIDKDVDTYVALSNPEDRDWAIDQRRSVDELRMFGVRQPWPLLLAAHRAFEPQQFTEVLRACSVVSFRYNVISNRATNEQERVYSEVAQRIASGKFPRSAEVIRALSPVYVPDRDFEREFAEKSFNTAGGRNKRVVRYILFQLERQLSGQEYDIDSSRYTLEHVLPQNPGDIWPQFSDEQFAAAVDRLGNLTLLDSQRNRDLGNAAFGEKRTAFGNDPLVITQKIAEENDEWTIDRIAARQRWMAAQATSIWRIAQLG